MTQKSGDQQPLDQFTLDAIIAEIEGVNEKAAEMDRKWGAGRLRLLVPPDWRAKFDRQRLLFNQATWGTYDSPRQKEEAIREAARATIRGYAKLDGLATISGASTLPLKALEVRLADGSVAAIVATNAEAHEVYREGRCMQVFTLEEFRSVVDGLPDMIQALHRSEGLPVPKEYEPIPDRFAEDARAPIPF